MTHPLHRRRVGAAPPPAVTPAAAGWRYAGLRVVELAPGEQLELAASSCELAVLPLAGACRVDCGGERFELVGRPDVFSRVTDFAYVPRDAVARITSPGGGRFALPSAEASVPLAPAYGPAEAVPIEIRGRGPASRQINNFLAPGAFAADRLIAVEVLTPAGNWSSYPPHKHDQAGPDEAVLEEIYYFEVARREPGGRRRVGEGFGLHRLYTTDGAIDLCAEVRHGDVVLVPRGYHGPSVAAPGYDLYYLNVLAGPGSERSMASCDDPAHHWVRASWAHQTADPRLPMATAAGPG
ncbi:MAG TPA: 5-deoxy-glucuronate isomerase [Candidatus Micrarchaeia archaeon]|nr:5-deoxy-glucuronate isomerase [Candidatus Micrarchaeia archaeon]